MKLVFIFGREAIQLYHLIKTFPPEKKSINILLLKLNRLVALKGENKFKRKYNYKCLDNKLVDLVLILLRTLCRHLYVF